MATVRPIDKSKPANHRCVNCIHWPKRRKNGGVWRPSDKLYHCDTAARDIDYWNCCKHFQWNPDKTYAQTEG